MSFFRFCAPESHSQVRILMRRKWLFINYDNGSEKLTYRNKHDTSTKSTYYVYFSEKGRAKYGDTRCAPVERLLGTLMNTTYSITLEYLRLIFRKHDANTKVREHDYQHRSTQFFEFSQTHSRVYIGLSKQGGAFSGVYQFVIVLYFSIWWFLFLMWVRCATAIYFFPLGPTT